jgi:hypothetical protein
LAIGSPCLGLCTHCDPIPSAAGAIPPTTARTPHPPVRVEIMGSQKCGIVAKSQSALITINPIIFTRTRMYARNMAMTQLVTGVPNARLQIAPALPILAGS